MTIIDLPFSRQDVAANLPAPGTWKPVPDSSDRAAWSSLPSDFVAQLTHQAETEIARPWPLLLATAYRRFFSDGDRGSWEDPYFARRVRLQCSTLMAAITGESRWLDDVIDGAWLLCEETTWCVSAHHPGTEPTQSTLADPECPTIDLFAAHTAAQLAFVDLILGDAIAAVVPIVRERLRREIDTRVLAPFAARDDWEWLTRRPMNNWTPWICSNLLWSALLVGSDAGVVASTATRVFDAVRLFLTDYPDDGGCDEGASYFWHAGGSLFDCLDTLRSASGGILDAFGVPVVRAIARYPVLAHISELWQVNFADASARIDTPDRNGRMANRAPVHVLYEYGRRVGDDEVVSHALALRDSVRFAPEGSGSFARLVMALFDSEWNTATDADFPYLLQSWLPDIEVLTARQHAGSDAGLFLAAKGGHNAESHNHNDVGSYIVAVDGVPVIVDAGVGTYTRQTFSGERYTIWTMQSSYHNLPEIDGYQQGAGRAFAASDCAASLDASAASLQLDISRAYPEQAGVRSWRRTSTLDRDAGIVRIADAWDLDRAAADLRWSVLVAGTVDTESDGVIVLRGDHADVRLRFDAGLFTVSVEAIELRDARLSAVWGDSLRRIRFVADSAPGRGSTQMVVDTR